jgi:hypothetical protein
MQPTALLLTPSSSQPLPAAPPSSPPQPPSSLQHDTDFEGGAITAYGHLELMVCTFKNNTANSVSGAGSGSVLRVAVHLLRCGWSA